MLQNVHKDFVK